VNALNLDNGYKRNVGHCELWKLTEAGAGINEQTSQNQINIYPNPASDLIYIEPASGYPWPSNVTLYNTQGQEVLNVIPQDSHERVKMDVKDFPDGLYFLKVYTNEGVLTRQVVIRK